MGPRYQYRGKWDINQFDKMFLLSSRGFRMYEEKKKKEKKEKQEKRGEKERKGSQRAPEAR